MDASSHSPPWIFSLFCSSDFTDGDGRPAPLWRVRYLGGSLEGDEEDLEEHELWCSLPPADVEALKAKQREMAGVRI